MTHKTLSSVTLPILNSILHGDCMEIMGLMPDNSVYLTLTDIPYDVVSRSSNGLREFDKEDADVCLFDLKHFVNEVVRITSGSIYVFCSTEQVSNLRGAMVELGLSTRLCIWEKTNPSPMNGQHIWLSGIECCVFGKKRGATYNEHCKNPIWRFPSGRSKIHPTEKPLNLFKYLIETSSDPSDLIFDPCLGSGTTAIAARELGRNYFGIELNKKYFDDAKKRIGGSDA